METVIALLVLILIGVWAVNILKPRKSNKKERFLGNMHRHNIDGEGYRSEVWEVIEDENSTNKENAVAVDNFYFLRPLLCSFSNIGI
jgi:hypothetical protein